MFLDVGELTYKRWRTDIRRWRTDFIRWRTGRWRTDTLAKRPVFTGDGGVGRCLSWRNAPLANLQERTHFFFCLSIIWKNSLWISVALEQFNCRIPRISSYTLQPATRLRVYSSCHLFLILHSSSWKLVTRLLHCKVFIIHSSTLESG